MSRTLALLKRYKRLVQAAALLLIAAFVAASVWKSWSHISKYSWHVNYGLLVAAFALLVTQEVSYAFIWRGILLRMGARLDIVSSQRIYLGAEFVRYIPGNVWHVITRVLWAEQRGVPKAVGLASMVVELATKITAAALVFAVSLFFWPSAPVVSIEIPRIALIAAGAVGIPLLLAGLHPRVLTRALSYGLRKLKREPVSFTLRYRDVLAITLYWALSWLVAGAGFYLLVRSLVSTPLPGGALAIAVGVYAAGWDVGFLSFITPSGIGFREVVIAALLTASLVVTGPSAAGLALVVAFVARLLSTGAELLCITVAHLVPGAPAPKVLTP
ncbi:MAG TPA: lysylphosphatidylglycerol synthase domain-containing protein [Ktedonobacterales bacterium]|nr:lysylphosphatidylglycerol synthase domain-containing protein [Ktedonobacterales bacterium]